MNDQMENKEQEAGYGVLIVMMLMVLALFITLAIAAVSSIAPIMQSKSDYQTQPAPAAQTPSTPSSTRYICNACGKPLLINTLGEHMEQHHEDGVVASYSTVNDRFRN